MTKKCKCPCCGYYTLTEEPPNTYDICKFCYWEDDGLQYEDPNYEGGANDMSLNQAKESYLKIGAISEEWINNVRLTLEDEKTG